jgi:hypothetical protein
MLSVAHYAVTNDRIISEYLIGKDVEGGEGWSNFGLKNKIKMHPRKKKY